EGLARLPGIVAVEPVNDVRGNLLIHRLRTLERKRPLVLAHLVLCRAVRRLHPEHWSRRCQAGAGLGVDGTRNLWNSRDWFLLAWRNNALLGRGLVGVGEAHTLRRLED